MASFLARRLGAMLLTMLCLTLVVFYLVNLEPNLRKLAISQTEMHASDQAAGELAGQERLPPPLPRALRGLARNLAEAAEHRPGDRRRRRPASRFATSRRRRGFSGVLQGDLGCSTKFKVKVVDKLGPALRGDRDPHVLGAGGHDPGRARDRRRLRHARRVAHRSRALDPLDRDDLDARIRVGRGAHHHLRHLARLAQRLGGVGDRRACHLLQFRLAGRDGRDLRHGLCRAHDPRLDDRGDERAIYPHRAPQGPRICRGRAQARAAQRADRAVHRHHASVPVAPDRRRDRRGDVPLPGLRPGAGRRRRQQRHRSPARLLARLGDPGAASPSSSPTSATPGSIRASACIRGRACSS